MRLRPETLALTATLAVLTSLGPLATDMYLPSLPAIGRDFAVPVASVQLTLSSFLFGFASGQVFYGPLSDRLGRKRVLMTGLVIFLVATVLCAFAPDIGWLTAGRFMQAFGASGPIVLARTIVRDLYEGRRAARELSRMAMIMGVVPALAPIAGGALHTLFGWRSVFWTIAMVTLVVGIVVALALPETIRSRLTDRFSLKAVLRDFGTLLAHPTYRVYVALSTLTFGGLFAFISGSSFVLQGIYGLSEMAFALSFTAMVAGYVGGTVLAQRLVDRLGLDGTIGAGVTCLALGGLVMLVAVAGGAASPLGIVLPMALYAVGVGLVMPQSMASAMQPFPSHAGAASSLLGICQMTGAALVGILVGHSLGGSALPLPAIITATGLGAATLFALTRRRRAL